MAWGEVSIEFCLVGRQNGKTAALWAQLREWERQDREAAAEDRWGDPFHWGDAMRWSPPPRVLTEAEVIRGES